MKTPRIPSRQPDFVQLQNDYFCQEISVQGCNYLPTPNIHTNKVHRSKGKTIFIVDAWPSEYKLDSLRNKKIVIKFIFSFLSKGGVVHK